jgi:ribosomal protein S12
MMAKKPETKTAKTVPVRLDNGVVIKAKIAAEDKGLDLCDYLSDLLRPTVERDWARARKKIIDS